MIFKTFNSDIDKISAKWGMFGRSFNDIGAAIAGRINDVKKSFQATDDLKGSFKDSEGVLQRLYPKKDIQSQLIDVDGLYPKIDKNNFDFDKWIDDLNDTDKQVKNGSTSWQDYSNKLDNNQKWIAKWGQETEGQIRTQEDMIKANQQARASALAHNEALKQQTLGAKAASAATKALSVAGSMIAMWAVTEAIQLAAKGIDHLWHSTEYAKEKAEKAKESISDLQSSYELHRKTVEDCASTYETLAKGVDVTTNKNLTLSDDEYKEYCDTVNKIAEAFPSLAKTIDENGVAILNFSDHTKTASENLQEFLDKEEKTANLKIAQSLPDLFGGVKAYKTELDNAQTVYDDLNEDMEALNALSNGIKDNEIVFSGTGDFSSIYNALISAIGKYRQYLIETEKEMDAALNPDNIIQVKSEVNGEYELTFFADGITDFNKLSEYISEAANEASGIILDSVGHAQTVLTDASDNYNTAWKDFTGNLVNAMHSNATYFSLDPVSQQLADVLVSNLSIDAATEMDDRNPYQWIRVNIISQLRKIDDSDQKQLFLENIQKLLSFKDGDLNVLSAADELEELFSEYEIKIDLTPIIGNELEAKEKLENNLNTIAGKNNFDKKELINWTKDFTTSEIELWLESTKGAKNAEDAIEKYKEALKKAQNSQPTPSFADAVSKVQSLSTGLDQLGQIYADVSDKGDFNWSSMLNNDDFKNTFGNFTKEYNDFIKTLSNSPDDVNACQSAFNRLATAYLNSSDAMKYLSAETKDATIKMLEQMGISNAKEVVSARLAAQEAFLAEKKNNAAIASDNLTDATWQEISAALAEANASDLAASYLARLALTKIDFSNNPINTMEDVNNIIAIAKAAGASGEYVNALTAALQKLQNAQDYKQNASTALDIGIGIGKELSAKQEISQLAKDIQNEISSANLDPANFYAKFNASAAKDLAGQSNAGGEQEKAAEASKQTFNWIEVAVKRIEQGVTRLRNTVASAFQTWADRNSSLRKQMSETRREIDLQQKAYERYMQEANSVGLSDDWAEKVKNGQISIDTVTDEDLADKINEYQEWHEKALDCKDAIDSLNESLSELYKTNFDNIASQYDSRLAAIDHEKSMISERLSQSGQSDYQTADSNNAALKDSLGHYQQLEAQERKNMAELELKKANLTAAFDDAINSGAIKEGSESWAQMQDNINEVTLAIEQSKTKLTEYANSISETYETAFNNVSAAYERMIGAIAHDKSMKNEAISQSEQSVYAAPGENRAALNKSIEANKALLSLEQENIEQLKREKADLTAAFNKAIDSGAIKEGSESLAQMRDKINEVTLAIEQGNTSVLSIADAIKQLYETAFDNILTKFDGFLNNLEHRSAMINEAIAQSEAKGRLVSVSYYQALINEGQKKKSSLEQKRDQLTKALNDAVAKGEIEQGSDSWHKMQQEIDDVNLELQKCNTSTLEWNNAINEIKWQTFDLLQDKISQITSEADFLIDLLSDGKLYDDKGQLTDEGLSTMGLHGTNYNVFMRQADNYASELKNIDQELANDPFNQNLLDRRQELVESQREMILAAEDEKQAIVSMVEEGIELELDALQKLIDAYSDALDAQKDLYDYQKKVADQTKDIASLQKQLTAYENDGSEETKAKIQQLKISLEEAKENLEETEYEKYVSDQKKLLDDLRNEYEQTLNERLDNVDALISDMIAEINAGAGTISDTLANTAESVGYELSASMSAIWSAGNGDVVNTLSVYGENITNGICSAATTINGVLNSIALDIALMAQAADLEAAEKTDPATSRDAMYILRAALGIEASDTNYTLEDANRVLTKAVSAKNDAISLPQTDDMISKHLRNEITLVHEMITPNIGNTLANNNMKIDVTLPNVMNYEQFKYAMQHDKSLEKMWQSMTIGTATGDNSLKKYKN